MALASASLFEVLRAGPALGRVFTADEETLGNERVAVLSYGLWNARFGARANIVGSGIRLDGDSFRVIGVMPEGFGFLDSGIDAYVPFAFTPEQRSDAARGNQFSSASAAWRLARPSKGLNAELDTIVQRNVADGRLSADAVTVAGFTGRAQPLRDLMVGSLERLLGCSKRSWSSCC